jgi:hypothetical protein
MHLWVRSTYSGHVKAVVSATFNFKIETLVSCLSAERRTGACVPSLKLKRFHRPRYGVRQGLSVAELQIADMHLPLRRIFAYCLSNSAIRSNSSHFGPKGG